MSETPVRLALVGAGAFGIKHLNGLRNIQDAEVAVVVSHDAAKARATADQYGVRDAATSLDATLERADIDAVILCTPTPLHARQAMACLAAGKHVEVEIPMADSLEGARALAAQAARSDQVAMCGHTRRFNPSHQFVHQRIQRGEYRIQHMDVQTFFFRRRNINALGEPRSWTDNLLWHHAAHTIDLFAYQCASPIVEAHALAGPIHPELHIPMDLSIQLKTAGGALCTLALSFNNEGPLGTFFRYIGDTATYIARYDDLVDGRGEAIDVSHVAVSMDGIELQDREFIAAIREGREPNSSIAQVLPCYEVLGQLAQQLFA